MATSATTNTQTFKITDITANCMEGLPPKKVEEILNLANDGTLWNSMEDFECAKADAAGKKTKAIGDSSFIIVDPNDPSIIGLGKFALREHDPNLVFKQVLFCLQSPIGIIFALVIRVQDGETLRDGGALIVEAAIIKKLLGWVELPRPLLKLPQIVPPYFQCAEADAGEDIRAPGASVPVDPTDPHVIAIGKFAVDTYNEKVHQYKLIFLKVEKGTSKNAPAGVIYSLIIAARIKTEVPPHHFQAIVFEHTSGKKELRELKPVDHQAR